MPNRESQRSSIRFLKIHNNSQKYIFIQYKKVKRIVSVLLRTSSGNIFCVKSLFPTITTLGNRLRRCFPIYYIYLIISNIGSTVIDHTYPHDLHLPLPYDLYLERLLKFVLDRHLVFKKTKQTWYPSSLNTFLWRTFSNRNSNMVTHLELAS